MTCQDAEAVQTRLSIEDKLLLEASQPWVHVPSSLILPSGGRSFEVKVLALATPENALERETQSYHLTSWTGVGYTAEAGPVLLSARRGCRAWDAGGLQQSAGRAALCGDLSLR